MKSLRKILKNLNRRVRKDQKLKGKRSSIMEKRMI
jgi:hypothetical protein